MIATEHRPDADPFTSPHAEPMPVFTAWLQAAREEGLSDPGAVALATTSLDGIPAARTVQIVGCDDRGIVFTSHRTSRKGRHLAITPWASALAYWREWGRQVELAGRVEELGSTESDALWAARPATTHPMSVESAQSERLEDEHELRTRAQALARVNGPLPRPRAWVGYRLVPTHVEFWEASADRLHRRLDYTWERGGWSVARLQP